jgi:hypothetical protein
MRFLKGASVRLRWFCWTGAAEDGRAPTEERAFLRSRDFCSTGAAEDGCAHDSRNTSQKLNEITLNQPTADSARYPFRFSGDRLDYRRVSLLVMPHLSYPTAVFLVATCIFVILAKLLKVGKGAVAMGVGVLIVWLVLHFTGYEETVYNIIFNPPPIQHAQPEDLIKR